MRRLGITQDVATARQSARADMKKVRDMANAIRYAVEPYSDLDRYLDDLQAKARADEKRHRGLGRRLGQTGRAGTVSDAVDVMVVQCMAHAVATVTVGGRGRVLRKTIRVNQLLVRGDYLAAIQLVCTRRALEALWGSKRLTPRKLYDVAELADYCSDCSGLGSLEVRPV